VPGSGIGDNLTKFFFKGMEEASTERKKKEMNRAMKGLIDSLSVLIEPPKKEEAPAEPAAAPGPEAPAWTPPELAGAPQVQPPMAPVPVAQTMFGGPSIPVPQAPMIPPAPPPTAAMPAPAAGAPRVSPQDSLRSGIFQAIGNAGDHIPEAVALVNKLFGNDFFEGDKKDLYGFAPGTRVTDKAGNVLFTVPDKPTKPSFGVSERGYLTTVNGDGSTEEHVGVRPMQTEVANIRNRGALAAAEARERVAREMAEGRLDLERLRQAGARSLTKYKVDLAATADPKTVQHYYVQLLNDFSTGNADEDDIVMMEYLRPIVEKQGILGTLLQSQNGEMPGPARAPWQPPAPAAPAAPSEKSGIIDRLFGGNKPAPAAPAPAAPAAPGKGPKPKTLQLQGKDGKAIQAELESDGNYYARINGQKYKVTPRK
jgi:hypothetical protein